MRPRQPGARSGKLARLSATADEYRRVIATGDWLEDRFVLVQAVTELGGGYWVLTPLAPRRRHAVLVNRGFVPADKRTRLPGGGSARNLIL